MTGKSYVTLTEETRLISGIAYAELMAAVLEKNGLFRFTATGCSMAPFIRDGDFITLSQPPVRLQTGDVVAFINPSCNRLMIHRIVRVSRQGYLIKGDNNSIPDGRIPASNILGRVVRVEREGRRIRFGLGAGNIFIAWLSRRCWLTPLILNARRLIKSLIRKWAE